MMPLPPRYLLPVPLPTPFRPGDPRHLDPLGLHVRDTTDPHKVRDRLVDIGVLRKNGDGTYSPYLPAKADLVNGKVPASQLPEDKQGVTEVLVDGVSVVSGGTARIDLSGKVDKEQGKGLSSNDYTAGEKQKLTGIEAGAQKNVAPVAPSTDPADGGKPADAYHTGTALSGKQATISDLDAIRAGAAAGATAVQSVNGFIPDTSGDVQLSGDDIPIVPMAGTSVNESLQLLAADLRYALGETITASAQLADRTVNRVAPEAENTLDIALSMPLQTTGRARDYLVLITNTAGNTGRFFFGLGDGVTIYGDGLTNSPASGETWLYSFTEVAADTFWVKSVKMEVAQ